MATVVHLESHVLDKERPHLVAETVRVEAPLHRPSSVYATHPQGRTQARSTDLKLEATLDALLQSLGDSLVEVAQDLHRKLRIYAFITDEVVERVRQSETDTGESVSVSMPVTTITQSRSTVLLPRRTCSDDRARRNSVHPTPWLRWMYQARGSCRAIDGRGSKETCWRDVVVARARLRDGDVATARMRDGVVARARLRGDLEAEG